MLMEMSKMINLTKLLSKMERSFQVVLINRIFTKTSKGLIHTIYNDLGPERTKDFIDDLQKITAYFLLIEGFSVGIGDMVADENTYSKITDVIQENKIKIDNDFKKSILTIFENFSGQSNNNYFEGKVNALLNNTIKQTGNVGLENPDQKNRVTNMVNSGSKGKPTNVAQIVACLGQQNVDGKRIPYGYNDRTLPHYSKYDDSSWREAFVENSPFISGQTPQNGTSFTRWVAEKALLILLLKLQQQVMFKESLLNQWKILKLIMTFQ